MDRPRKKVLLPTVNIGPKRAILNRVATELLLQNGTRYVLVQRQGQEISIKPLAIHGNIVEIRGFGSHRGILYDRRVFDDRKSRRFCATWNDKKGVLNIDLSKELQRNKRSYGAPAKEDRY